MPYIRQKMNISGETISAIFIIAVVSFFILANFAAGFFLPLFVLTMAVGAGIAFFYPRSGLAAIIFLTFIYERFFTLQPIIRGRAEYKLYPLDIILAAVLAGIIFNFINSCYGLRSQSIGVASFIKKLAFWKKQGAFRADFYLITFIILAAIYFLISAFVLKTDFNLSFSSLKHYSFYPLLYFVILATIKNREQILWLFKFAFAGAIVIVFFIIYGFVTGHGLWSEFTPLSTEGIRTLAFPHAFYLSLAIIGLIIYLIFSEKSDITKSTGRSKMLYRNFYWVLMLVWAIGIIGSMMRHLWVSIFLSLCVLHFIIPKEKRINLRKILINSVWPVIIVLIFTIYLSLLFPNSVLKEAVDSAGSVIGSRVKTLASVSGDESFSWRSAVWKEATKEYLKSPIFGIGLGKYIFIEIEKYKDFVEVRNIHNSPLVLFVQMGIAAFVIFAIFVFKNLKKIYRKAEKDWLDVLLIVLLVNFLIAFLFQPYLETNLLGIFFWILLGLIRVATCKTHESTNPLQIYK